jgi:pimeloyl-ACP methyl ester carboxylesterase
VLLVHGSYPEIGDALAQGLAAQGFGVAHSTLPGLAGEGTALQEITIKTRIVQAQFTSEFGSPERTYLFGFSRGAHNMTNLLETSLAHYDGMLSVCGGNGGSQLQWDYFFTARILFDYYYPDVWPGNALGLPEGGPELLDGYLAQVAPRVASAIVANPGPAYQMAAVEQYGLSYNDFGELVSGIVQSLAIHTIGLNDLLQAANGNPFDNSETVYSGTAYDQALNAGVARLSADPQAQAYLRVWYGPTGAIAEMPVLLLHTTRDPMIPEQRNNEKYASLVQGTGNGDFLVRRTVEGFGHCPFSGEELLGIHFPALVTWVETGVPPWPIANSLPFCEGGN